jgi:hypothetical protein
MNRLLPRLAGTALAFTLSCGVAGAGRHRCRRHLPGTDLCQVGRRLQQGHGCPHQLPVGRLRCGIKQIKAKTVDFGASDMPLKDDDLAKDGMVQFPTVIGGVVPVVNIKGISPARSS